MTAYADIGVGLATINTAIVKGLEDIYNNKWAGNYQLYTDTKTSDTLLNEVAIPGATPVLREWTGAKHEKSFRVYAQTHTSIPMEKTLKIRKQDLKFNRTGLVQDAVNRFLTDIQGEIDYHAFAKMIANPTGIDAVALFSASHTEATSAGGTQGNYGTSVLTLVNLIAARTAMMAWTNEADMLLELRPDTLIVGPSNIQKAKEICEASLRLANTNISGAEATSGVMDTAALTNVWQGNMKVVEEPRLTGTYAYYWFLLDSKRAKPMIQIVSEALHPVALDKETDMPRFYNNEYVWSVEGFMKFAPFNWSSIYAQYATS
jgi:phage major head subunit gpT-like protein